MMAVRIDGPLIANPRRHYSASQHRRQHPIRRLVSIHERLDVDDDLVAHIDAALNGGRTGVWQQHHLAGAREPYELRVDRRLVLEHV